jgi:D-sedoheptulose 7-phosphate isomerase
MMTDRARIVADLDALAQLLSTTAGQADTIAALAHRYRETLRAGGTLLFAGNGGSAADAQHIAAEYVVRFRTARGPRRALALTTDSSVLTAAGNDLGFDQVFAREVEALGRPGDLLILHSTSGESANLLAAARAARERGIPVVALLGKGGGRLAALADLALVVASNETCHVQEVHLAVQHTIAGLLDGEDLG